IPTASGTAKSTAAKRSRSATCIPTASPAWSAARRSSERAEPRALACSQRSTAAATIGWSRRWTSHRLALPYLRRPMLWREIGLRRRGAEQGTRLGLVVCDRGHGEVGVLPPLRIFFDAQIEAPQPQIQPNPARLIHGGLGEVFRIEAPSRLDQ